jgi:2,4-dienoyl-CoA reductase-like NADH-dependent reductase (Old Yellow Enzyme family)
MPSPSPRLFRPLTLRGTTFRNRTAISPMCMYSAEDGMAGDFHMVHLGKFALGGAGLVIAEATAVSAVGRISYSDLGLWKDCQIPPLSRVTRFIELNGAVPGIQLNHAGRKAAGTPPWDGGGALTEEDRRRGFAPWRLVAPSALAADGWPAPAELSQAEIGSIIDEWVAAARRAVAAGFRVIEVHGGHGYLVHQFLSAISNRRTDCYGGNIHGRARFAVELCAALRSAIPDDMPLFCRLSAMDGAEGGWTMQDTVTVAKALAMVGADLIDCSSGGMAGATPTRAVPRGLGFQVPYAAQVRREANIATLAVGLILTAAQAEAIIAEHAADLIGIGREALFNPNWPLHAALALGIDHSGWPLAYRGWLERRAETLEKINVMRRYDEELHS